MTYVTAAETCINQKVCQCTARQLPIWRELWCYCFASLDQSSLNYVCMCWSDSSLQRHFPSDNIFCVPETFTIKSQSCQNFYAFFGATKFYHDLRSDEFQRPTRHKQVTSGMRFSRQSIAPVLTMTQEQVAEATGSVIGTPTSEQQATVGASKIGLTCTNCSKVGMDLFKFSRCICCPCLGRHKNATQ